MICDPCQISLWWLDRKVWKGRSLWHACGESEHPQGVGVVSWGSDWEQFAGLLWIQWRVLWFDKTWIILDFKPSQCSKYCILIYLVDSPATEFYMTTFQHTLSVPSSPHMKWNRVFRNVGILNSDAGESPKSKNLKNVGNFSTSRGPFIFWIWRLFHVRFTGVYLLYYGKVWAR